MGESARTEKDDDEDRTWWCFFKKKKKIHGKKCEEIPCPSMKITFTKNHFKVLYLVVSRKKRKKTLNFNAELQTAISCLPCKRKKPNTMDLRRTRGPFFFVMKITTRKIGLSKILHEFFFLSFFSVKWSHQIDYLPKTPLAYSTSYSSSFLEGEKWR